MAKFNEVARTRRGKETDVKGTSALNVSIEILRKVDTSA
jgi:hypothetical protein